MLNLRQRIRRRARIARICRDFGYSMQYHAWQWGELIFAKRPIRHG